MNPFPIIPLLKEIGQIDPEAITKHAEELLRASQVAATSEPKIKQTLKRLKELSQGAKPKALSEQLLHSIAVLELLLTDATQSPPTPK